ncbi:MAG: HD domain-containing protein [Deltaproteobacteria bacterium]|nr:HD domain-containing protein [Deltaproteobacteria bacterium]
MLGKIPRDILEVCQRLSEQGAAVHLVGGAVRDLLLGEPTGDFDLATSATPDQVSRLFERVANTGLKHGTVTVVTDNNSNVEVTTYRTEDRYGDGRHPDSVVFVGNIEQDLARRDFTVNAMALSFPEGQLVDPYNGRADLAARLLRSVGVAERRFLEDGLRLLRACRFCATLEFEIEKSTKEGMEKARQQLALVSPERQRDELTKTLVKAQQPSRAFFAAQQTGLLGQFLPELERCVGYQQNKWHKYDVFEHTMKVLDEIQPGNLNLRLAALLHDVGKPDTMSEKDGERHFYDHEQKSSEIAAAVMTRLRFSNSQIDQVSRLIAEHMWYYEKNWSDAAVRRFLRRIGGAGWVVDTFELRRADILGRGRDDLLDDELKLTAELLDRINEQIENNYIFSIEDLPVNGHDVMSVLGIGPGPRVGEALKWLLEKIELEPEKNERDIALELIARHFANR